MGGKHRAPPIGLHGSQHAIAGGSHRRVAGGRGPRAGEDGGRERADVLLELGPECLPRAGGAETHHRGEGGSQG
jgi:hypothetical protein